MDIPSVKIIYQLISYWIIVFRKNNISIDKLLNYNVVLNNILIEC